MSEDAVQYVPEDVKQAALTLEWPLFTVKVAVLGRYAWAFLDKVKEVHGQVPGGLKALLEEIAKLERSILKARLTGWVICVEKTNTKVLRWMWILEGQPYHEDETCIFFYKVVTTPFTTSPKEALRRQRAHGQAQQEAVTT